MSKKARLQRYLKFIGNNQFLQELIPDLLPEECVAEPIESYIFTSSPKYVKVTLRDYQIEGLNWLINMHENGINCILADEMGLGKTLQSISFLGYLKYIKGEKNKHLIVVPKSCLQNWYNEFKKFIPEMNVKIFHTSKTEIKRESKTLIDKKYDVILTTYEMCLFAKNWLKEINWSYILIDEAHRLKNENSQLSKIVRLYRFKHRLLLTGTPLQNNIHELWALLNFIVPDIFNNAERFEQYVLSADKEDKNIENLRNVLQLFFLRREKIDVEKSLKAKKCVNIYCPLVDLQREWYKSILKKDLSGVYLNKGVKTTLLNIVMQLKKCCNHPYLFEGAEPEPYETGEHLIFNSGKMLILDKLLQNLKSKNSRVLIFSQMAQMLDILEDYVVYKGYDYCRIDGKTSSEDRTKAIEDYNTPDSKKFVFLLTTRAGGLGINLYTADTVIIFDSDWNPQADLQAQDRAHRIGQKRQVHVFRFITENTIEEGVYLRAQQKLKLDDILIQKGKKINNSISDNELMDILSHGMDIDQDVNMNMSIEEILKKGEEKTKELEDKMSTFKLADTVDTKINLYQWEGENYAKKKIEQFIESNTEESKVKRNTLFGNKHYKKLIFPEYQFCPQEFYDLQDKEESLYNKGQELTEEEKDRKNSLLEQLFEWTKKEFRIFLSAVDHYYDDIEKIKAQLPNKTDVLEYYNTFMNRYKELAEGEKYGNMIEKAKVKSERKSKLKNIFKKHGDNLDQSLISKNRFYIDNVRLLKLYKKYIDYPNCFDKIKDEILHSDESMFDFFLMSKTPTELSKHLNVLISQLLKSND